MHALRPISSSNLKFIEDKDTLHATVCHWKKEYVRGIVHANTLENVWSLFKRSIIGSYHQAFVKHLDRYLDEFEFRFNNREKPYLLRDTLLRLLQTSNLEYRDLTKDEAPDCYCLFWALITRL